MFPNLPVRSFIWEEGTNAEIARDILSNGNLLQPEVYGIRWNEKPSLLPWLIAGVAKITGEVNEFSARLPAMIAVVLTALLVHSLTRRYASRDASLLAALFFMFSPMLIQKLAIAEPDTLVTLLSFAAFVLWWNGVEVGRIGIWRWIGCGLLLAVLAMAKGPQPVGYFALAVSAYVAVTRRWRDIPGLFACLTVPAMATVAWAAAVYQPGDEATWISYARLHSAPSLADYLVQNTWVFLNLIVELLPSILLAPFLMWQVWQKPSADVPSVALPLALYAGICTIAVVLWPGSNSRYAMPCAPALAVLAGFAWEALAGTAYARFRGVTVIAVCALASFQIALANVVMPVFADRFGASRIAGQTIERAVRADPAPAFCTDLATNQLFYARVRIRCIDAQNIASVTAPAWLIMPRDQAPLLAQLKSGQTARVVAETESGPRLSAIRLEKQ
ncbi:MAG: glycosyltransferase family 39 protein [Afipia sp.]|nr:glycosyltransferase family 39 protein [Afipia sp.]